MKNYDGCVKRRGEKEKKKKGKKKRKAKNKKNFSLCAKCDEAAIQKVFGCGNDKA